MHSGKIQKRGSKLYDKKHTDSFATTAGAIVPSVYNQNMKLNFISYTLTFLEKGT